VKKAKNLNTVSGLPPNIELEKIQHLPTFKALKVKNKHGPSVELPNGVSNEELKELDKPWPEGEKVKRFPRSLEAFYLQPLRREAKYGIPSCDLQMRSYSVRNLEFFADFALRAAYYLGLPAFGPVPLPRLEQRWTVPKSPFIFKKSQENFNRITLRRLIQIRDGNPETVQVWLAFLQKHAYYGIGMKANVWEFSDLSEFFFLSLFSLRAPRVTRMPAL
jgi:ribosomal protein S10